METLQRQVGRARRRLLVESFLNKLARCWLVTLLLALAAVGAAKWWSLGHPAWAYGPVAVALAAGLVAAGIWTWLARQDALQAALAIDQRFGLKERISSTLALGPAERETAIGQALVRDAEQKVRALDVADQFRPRLNRRAWLPLVPAALAVALVAFVPPRAVQTPVIAATSTQIQTKKSTEELVKKLAAKKKEASEKGLKEADAIARLEEGAKKLVEKTPEDRKEALKALNDLVKEAEQRRQELAGKSDLKEQLAGLKNLNQGPADKLGQALKSGDINKAIKELEKLKEELKSDKLDPAAKEALGKQLDQLQQSLAKQVEAHKQAERELAEKIEAERKAGNTAAADKLQQQLDKLAAKKPQAEKLEQMAQQLKQAAECMQQGDCKNAGEALGQMAQELGDMQQDLQEMEAMGDVLEQMAECKRSMACKECQGDGCKECQGGGDGEWNKTGGKLTNERFKGGGKGIGVGLGPGLGPETDPKGKFYDTAAKQQPGKGPAKVVGEADGPNRKGAVQEAIQQEFSAAEQQSADPLGEQRLPHEYRDHARKYFDALREGER